MLWVITSRIKPAVTPWTKRKKRGKGGKIAFTAVHPKT